MRSSSVMALQSMVTWRHSSKWTVLTHVHTSRTYLLTHLLPHLLPSLLACLLTCLLTYFLLTGGTRAAGRYQAYMGTHQPWAPCDSYAHQPWVPHEHCLAGCAPVTIIAPVDGVDLRSTKGWIQDTSVQVRSPTKACICTGGSRTRLCR